jgi:hypothetical protein
MRAKEFLNEVNIDNAKGAGAVPYNTDVDYFGVRVLMEPSTFLSLAAPLTEPVSKEGLMQHLKSGGAIGSPFLDINVPPEWDDGNFKQYAKIRGHEGRNRMMAVMDLEGDAPIEVHLFFKQYRRREVTDQMIAKANEGMIREQTTTLIPGPLFKVIS